MEEEEDLDYLETASMCSSDRSRSMVVPALPPSPSPSPSPAPSPSPSPSPRPACQSDSYTSLSSPATSSVPQYRTIAGSAAFHQGRTQDEQGQSENSDPRKRSKNYDPRHGYPSRKKSRWGPVETSAPMNKQPTDVDRGRGYPFRDFLSDNNQQNCSRPKDHSRTNFVHKCTITVREQFMQLNQPGCFPTSVNGPSTENDIGINFPRMDQPPPGYFPNVTLPPPMYMQQPLPPTSIPPPGYCGESPFQNTDVSSIPGGALIRFDTPPPGYFSPSPPPLNPMTSTPPPGNPVPSLMSLPLQMPNSFNPSISPPTVPIRGQQDRQPKALPPLPPISQLKLTPKHLEAVRSAISNPGVTLPSPQKNSITSKYTRSSSPCPDPRSSGGDQMGFNSIRPQGSQSDPRNRGPFHATPFDGMDTNNNLDDDAVDLASVRDEDVMRALNDVSKHHGAQDHGLFARHPGDDSAGTFDMADLDKDLPEFGMDDDDDTEASELESLHSRMDTLSDQSPSLGQHSPSPVSVRSATAGVSTSSEVYSNDVSGKDHDFDVASQNSSAAHSGTLSSHESALSSTRSVRNMLQGLGVQSSGAASISPAKSSDYEDTCSDSTVTHLSSTKSVRHLLQGMNVACSGDNVSLADKGPESVTPGAVIGGSASGRSANGVAHGAGPDRHVELAGIAAKSPSVWSVISSQPSARSPPHSLSSGIASLSGDSSTLPNETTLSQVDLAETAAALQICSSVSEDASMADIAELDTRSIDGDTVRSFDFDHSVMHSSAPCVSGALESRSGSPNMTVATYQTRSQRVQSSDTDAMSVSTVSSAHPPATRTPQNDSPSNPLGNVPIYDDKGDEVTIQPTKVPHDDRTVVFKVPPPNWKASGNSVFSRPQSVKSRMSLASVGSVPTFSNLLLDEQIQKQLIHMNLWTLTPVQQLCFPAALSGQSIMVYGDKTTGKTLLHAISILDNVKTGQGKVQAVIISPFRDKAFHVFDIYSRLAQDKQLVIVNFSGGSPYKPQKEMCLTNPPDVIIGTPGRVSVMVKNKHLNLDDCKFVVLEEMGKMIEFENMQRDVDIILNAIPPSRQMIGASAECLPHLMPECNSYFNADSVFDCRSVWRTTNQIEDVNHKYVIVNHTKAYDCLLDLVNNCDSKVIIYRRSPIGCAHLVDYLNKNGIPAMYAAHGRLTKARPSREQILEQIPKVHAVVSHAILGIYRFRYIINFAIPVYVNAYLRRIGKTSYFNRDITIINMVKEPADLTNLRAIQDYFKLSLKAVKGYEA